VADPFRNALAQHERIVAEPEDALEKGRLIHYIGPTSSGNS